MEEVSSHLQCLNVQLMGDQNITSLLSRKYVYKPSRYHLASNDDVPYLNWHFTDTEAS